MSEKPVMCPKCNKIIFLFPDFENVEWREFENMMVKVKIHMLDHRIHESFAAKERPPNAFISESELDLEED